MAIISHIMEKEITVKEIMIIIIREIIITGMKRIQMLNYIKRQLQKRVNNGKGLVTVPFWYL